MSDKELLLAAAKAAGVVGEYKTNGKNSDGSIRGGIWIGHGNVFETGNITGPWWNPLKDDGDALRLAVKLNMGISIHDNHCTACAQIGIMQTERDTGTTAEVTRRAIVRAAAAIGRGM